MLRITTTPVNGVECHLTLEGKLTAAWVRALREACCAAGDDCRRLHLDLSQLSFVDGPGITALRDLIRQGARITKTSPLVGALLREE